MFLLIVFSFFAGVMTILSPCILPILPIILSSGFDKTKSRPLGIITGFILSFTFFTLFLSLIIGSLEISAQALRISSVLLLVIFGVILVIPALGIAFEKLTQNLLKISPKQSQRNGFWGGLLIGSSLGLVWTPCVGPILASVITLAVTGTVTFETILITFSYALGTSLPMFLIITKSQKFLDRQSWLKTQSLRLQKIFGLVIILTGISIYFSLDKVIQSFVLRAFPHYSSWITFIENTSTVDRLLKNL